MFNLHLGGASHHLDHNEDFDYNESHNLVLIERESYVGGYFKNSYGNDSLLAAKRYDWTYKRINYGFMAGIVYGYEDYQTPLTWNKLTPALIPYIQYDYEGIKPTVSLMGTAVVLSVEFDFVTMFTDKNQRMGDNERIKQTER